MYSKSQSNNDTPFRIPDNYRGNAFQSEDLRDPPIPMTDVSEEQNTPVSVEKEDAAPSSPSAVEAIRKAPPPSPLASLLPPRPTLAHGGLLGDIGLEELLILGILLLLSQGESDNDVPLLLMLLLFYK